MDVFVRWYQSLVGQIHEPFLGELKFDRLVGQVVHLEAAVRVGLRANR